LKTKSGNISENISEKGFSITEDFLSTQEVHQVLSKIKALQEEKNFKPAGIGNKDQFHQNKEIRNDSIFWIGHQDEFFTSLFFSRIEELILELNRSLYLGIKDYEFHLAHYKAGNFYKKHRDAFRSDDARILSVVCYLNLNRKPEDGGELKLYIENQVPITIEPIAGKLVIFESHLEHEVLESHTDRYSITGWLKNKSRLF
jgi:SM-20-related protein